MICKVCGRDEDHSSYEVLEMQFGSREPFPYFQCGACGCLQIGEFPADMSPYYPDSIYSGEGSTTTTLMDVPLPNWCVATMLGGPVVTFGDLQTQPADGWEAEATRRALDFYLAGIEVEKDWRVLDVGTADGSFLRSLRRAGFRSTLHGVDPFLHHSLRYDDEKVTVEKGDLLALPAEPQWDLMTFHHTLECVSDPPAVFKAIAERLAPGGVCMIRSHTVPCYAWEQFRENWVAIDAPRNFFLYSPESLELLAESVGLRLEQRLYDSTAFQFWGSLQYSQGHAIYSEESLAVNPQESGFPLERLGIFEQTAKALNQQQRGDQAAFYFRHA